MDRHQEALKVLNAAKKKEKQQLTEKQEKLKQLDQERLDILGKTKKRKFEPPLDGEMIIQMDNKQEQEQEIQQEIEPTQGDILSQDQNKTLQQDQTQTQTEKRSKDIKESKRQSKTQDQKSDKQQPKFKGESSNPRGSQQTIDQKRGSVQQNARGSIQQQQQPRGSIQQNQNPFYDVDHKEQQLNKQEYEDFKRRQDQTQMKIEKIINSRNVSLKADVPLSAEEQKIQNQLRFLAPDGRELPNDFVKQIFEDAEIQDAPPQAFQQNLMQPNPDNMQEYHKQVENEIKKKLFQQRDQPVQKKKTKKENQPQTPPIELRKKAEWQRAVNEAERLRSPDIRQIYKQPLQADDFGQNLGEFEGLKLKGMQPFWNELKVKGLERARNDDSDSDVYVETKKKSGQQHMPRAMKDEKELLEKIETFNDKKMKSRVQQGKSKRIPLGDNQQNYEQSYKQYKSKVNHNKNDLWDSEDEQIILRNKNQDVDFDPVKDQIFELNSDDLFTKNFIDVE